MEKERNNNCESLNICSNCGNSVKNEWKFCPYCKKLIEASSCSSCGQKILSKWNYCPTCKNEINADIKNKIRVDKCNEWLRDMLKK